VKDPESGAPRTDVTPADYIRANFQPSDRIAVLVRSAKRGETVQRISTAHKIGTTQFQEWIRYKNEKDGCDIYIGMNTLKQAAFTRTKDDILAVRHLYVDLDHDGSTSLSLIEKSTLVPAPNYILNTSPNKYQAIWKVEDIDLPEAEALLHALAREFDGDRAATDAARVLRLPGFMNKKYESDFLVRARLQTDQIYRPRDFKVRAEGVESDHRRVRNSPRKITASEPRPITQSERDWAYVKSSLASGADPEELIAQLARSRAADKPDPQYYARLTITKALADLRTSSMSSGNAQIPDSDGHRETEH
jgi:RepB DNA-primase from phage plasmid